MLSLHFSISLFLFLWSLCWLVKSSSPVQAVTCEAMTKVCHLLYPSELKIPWPEWATEILEHGKIKLLSSNYWYIRGWFHLAVQLPSRGCMTAGGCSLIKANRLFILWHWAYVLGYRRFIVFCFPDFMYGPTVTRVQDELCPYLLLVEPFIGTPYVYRIQTQIFRSVILVAASPLFMPLFFLSEEHCGVVLPS